MTNTIVRNGIVLPNASPNSAGGRVSFSTINAGALQCSSSGGAGAVGFKFDNDIIFGVGPNVITNSDDSCFDHDIAYPQSASVGTNMLLVDPKLVDLPGGNYRLTAQSPAIDAADPASTDVVDFEDTPRPQGSARDLGAFEYH